MGNYKTIAIWIFVSFFWSCSLFSQTGVDSVVSFIKIGQNDTNKVNALNKLALQQINTEPQKSMLYSDQALKLSKKLGFKKGIAMSYHNLGYANFVQANYPATLEYWLLGLSLKEEMGDKKGSSALMGNVGNVYRAQGDYEKALDYYFKALKIKEELSDKNGIATWLTNIGIVYNSQAGETNDRNQKRDYYRKALTYYMKALNISHELEDKNKIAALNGNIGIIYSDQGDLTIDKTSKESNYNRALGYLFKALKLGEELGDENRVTIQLGNIGGVYAGLKQYKQAEDYLLRALTKCDEIGAMDFTMQFEEVLSDIYNETGQHEKALIHYKKFTIAKDSIFNEENTKQTTRLEMNFEFEKQAALTAAITAEHDAKQKVVIWSVGIGLGFMFIIALLIFRTLRVTRRQKQTIEHAHAEISEQKKLVDQQRSVVEEKNKEITDSILYAKRIQDALITSETYIERTLQRINHKNS
jgi:tetratricopeptide (TPR) repeat protein